MPLWLVLEPKSFACSGDGPGTRKRWFPVPGKPLQAPREGALGEGALPKRLVPQKSKWL